MILKNTFMLFLLYSSVLYGSENVTICVNLLRTIYESLLTEDEWNEALTKRNSRVALYFIYYKAQEKSFFFASKRNLKTMLLKECEVKYKEYFSCE